MIKKIVIASLVSLLCFCLKPTMGCGQKIHRLTTEKIINLAGTWQFQIDSLDQGVKDQWFNKTLEDHIDLPGSMTTNKKGNDITVQTPWTGSIIDSSWFLDPKYAPYRQAGNIKVPFWLQPVKYYKGAAWYQKTVTISGDWKNQQINLFLERCHWETTVWVDDQEIGMENSLSTGHDFDLTKILTPGKHRISIRVDNRVKEINVGENSHSISDHTQGNWNGMIGSLLLKAKPLVYIEDVQVFPDIKLKQIKVRVSMVNKLGHSFAGMLSLQARTAHKGTQNAPVLMTRPIKLTGDSSTIEWVYPMGDHPMLWDEFNPNLYTLVANLSSGEKNKTDLSTTQTIHFGMREFATRNTQFTINGRLTFLRGTLECAIFPKTGYPPTDVEAWLRIFRICRSYGLNHMRFHSWCPPEAAFDAADQSGFYLQIECASWANSGSSVGSGAPLDKYLYEESNRIVKAYGNHPSFCMMAYGNEPAGPHLKEYLTKFVQYWKGKDARRLYTTAAGWPIVAENNYNSTPDPRIQSWGGGLKSIINAQAPKSDYDWSSIISKWHHPTVSHEIGQWCVYPDFKEMKQYTGIMKARNFEIFQDKLKSNGLSNLSDSFLMASGKLQTLCYKADIEAALRTPGFGGFQLLDLHDFPGQGTALVGVLNPFWEEKGYVTAKEYSQFCNAVVPLARLPKMIWLNNESLKVPVEVANFGASALTTITPQWKIEDKQGKTLFKGSLNKKEIPLGNAVSLGEIDQNLSSVTTATQLKLTISVGEYQNAWTIFVYPASLPKISDVVVTSVVDQAIIDKLNRGAKVLLSFKKEAVKKDMGGNIAIGFSSIFWNTAWTKSQPPVTLGVLCDPKHPALSDFPTDFYSSWQWWDAMSHSSPIVLDSIAQNLKPLVRVIDDWVTARSLGLVFECKIGKGSLVVSGIDLTTDVQKRPEARQLRYSLEHYMQSTAFHPEVQVSLNKIRGLYE